IAGNHEVKDQVEDIIGFIKDPQKYTQLGARMPKGLIFYGPPGTGKTLMAKAIAKEAGVPFFSLSGSDFVQMYVGVGASRIREVFKEARKHERAVIFIDEIDAIGKKRSNNLSGSNEEKDQTLNALLTEMSGFKHDEGIVVIAATNRLELLDDALLRPGRFDRQIEIGYPDQGAREQIIKLYLQGKPISDEVDSEKLARQTVRFTGAMLENLLNEAAILAAKAGEIKITMNHIEKAFSVVLAGAEKKDRSYITQEERRITAFHEAGHALITKLIVPMQRVVKVTIVPTVKGAGGFSMSIPKDSMYMTKRDFISQIQIALAGRAAEEIIFGKDLITTGASNDIEKATYYLKELITRYGMDDTYGLINCEVICPGSSNQELLKVCKEKMDQIYEETKLVLKEHEEKLMVLAEALLEHETLNEDKIIELIA
ncbi:AAA family ATPase, partial [Zhenhengia sp.]